jgi:hypothetical protein
VAGGIKLLIDTGGTFMYRIPGVPACLAGVLVVTAINAANDDDTGVAGDNAIDARPIDARLADLDWLTGSWTGEGLGGEVEEHWSKPAGGTMIGMFRLVVSGDTTRVSEFLMIEQEGDRVAYRFRHYGPRHVPWEKEEPLVFDLVKLADREAVFHSSEQTNPKRLTYRRVGDHLTIHVQAEENGQLTDGFTIQMKRGELGAD